MHLRNSVILLPRLQVLHAYFVLHEAMERRTAVELQRGQEALDIGLSFPPQLAAKIRNVNTRSTTMCFPFSLIVQFPVA